MRQAIVTAGLTAILGCLVAGQPAPKAPPFEAADVHVSAPGATESGGFLPNGRLEFRATTLLDLITVAYSVQADNVVGGPSWLDTDRFDVVAKAPSAASQIALRNMMQGLLEERFGLAIQRQEKPQPVYALVLGKRGAPKESAKPGQPECRTDREENVRTLTCHNVTMQSLAERLPQVAPAYFNHTVVDRTGLKGEYDFQLSWLPRGQLPAGGEGNAFHVFTSIEKQLGVSVEAQTAPMPVLTIAHVNRKPSDNPPGVTEKLGAAPTEFEVADIHRSRPDETQDATINNGRVDARALSIKELISFAYDAEDDWVKGGEKWLETERFDIVAKSVPTASVDTLRTMLQALLADRFRLKIHREQQPVSVYALTAGKPKLKEADPSTRSTCKPGNADGLRTYTCQNTTMAQLAAKLRDAAAGYLDHPIVDLTGLTGAYDFTLSWTGRGRLLGPGRGDGDPAAGVATSGSAAPTASDRPAGLTVFEAVDRQLGLKLAARKHPMPVIVIDHVDRMPTEN